jgi:hypothetical protein
MKTKLPKKMSEIVPYNGTQMYVDHIERCLTPAPHIVENIKYDIEKSKIPAAEHGEYCQCPLHHGGYGRIHP